MIPSSLFQLLLRLRLARPQERVFSHLLEKGWFFKQYNALNRNFGIIFSLLISVAVELFFLNREMISWIREILTHNLSH